MNQEIQSFELAELFSSLSKNVRSPCKNEYIVSADEELQILNTDELKTTEAGKGLIKSIWCDDKVRFLTQSKELFQGLLNRVISVENQNKETELLDRNIVSKLLHLCCMFDAVDCSSALINGEFGTVPLVNEMDETGRSALHKAADVHASRCIELLLRKGARTDVKTKNGGSQLALELSLSSRRMDVVWNVDDPIEDLLVCLNQKDLTAVRLLADATKDVAQVAFTIAMEGQVVSLAALLMVCAERVISSMVVVRKDANRVYKEETVYDCVIREALSLGQIITSSTAGGTCAETEIVEKMKLLFCEMELLQLYGAAAQSVSIDKKVTSQVEGPTSLSGALSPVTILKVDLELSPTLKIKDQMQNTCILTLCFRQEDNNIGLLVAADTRSSKMLVVDPEQNNVNPTSLTHSSPFRIPGRDTNELVGDKEEKLYRITNEIWMGIAGRLGFGRNIVKSLQSMYEKSSKRSVEMVATSCFDLAKSNYAEWNKENEFAFSALVFGFDIWGPQTISDPRVVKIHYKFTKKEIIKDLQTELFADAGSGGDFGKKFLREKYRSEKKGITDFTEALGLLKAACKRGCDRDFSTGPKFEVLVMKKKQMKTKTAVTVNHEDEFEFVKTIM